MDSRLSKDLSGYQHNYYKMENPLVTYRASYSGSLWDCEVYNPKTDRPIPKAYQKKTTVRIDMTTSLEHLDIVDRNTIASFRYHADPEDGSLDIYYRKSPKCDRLFSFGYLNLQGLKKDPCRNLLLQGKYDIDIKNCFPTIIVQSLKKDHGVTLKYLQEYVDNTDEIREKISLETSLPIKVIKTFILGILNGAERNRFADFYKYPSKSFKGILDQYSSHIVLYYYNQLYKSTTFSNICSDLKEAYRYLGRDSKKISRFNMSIERRVLDLVYNHQSKVAKDPLQLLCHDGYVTEKPIGDLSELEGLIEDSLGYSFKLTQEPIVYTTNKR